MKKTSKWLALALAAVMAGSLTACSGSGNGGTTAAETTAAESTTAADTAEAATAGEAVPNDNVLLMATTTSTDDTGLLDYLQPLFLEDTGIDLQWTAVGTGDAIQMGRDGEVDIVLVHSRCV